MNTEAMFSSKTDLWATPKDFFDRLDAEFGFTLDACALPENAKKYVDFLESKIGVPIKMVSTGPKRHEMTYRK